MEEIKIPEAFDVPDALKYLRSNVLDVLREYEIERAGVRVTEANADPPVQEAESIETLDFLSMASIGVLIAVREIVFGTSVQAGAVEVVANEYARLSESIFASTT